MRISDAAVLSTTGTFLARKPVFIRPFNLPGRRGRDLRSVHEQKHPLRSVAYVARGSIRKGLGIRAFSNNPSPGEIAYLAARVEQGWLRPVINTVYPLDEVAQAYRSLEAGGVRGKHVIGVKAGL